MDTVKVIWANIPNGLHAELSGKTTEELAQAYLQETANELPDFDRLLGIWELGQARFPERFNSRLNREQLFLGVINRLFQQAN